MRRMTLVALLVAAPLFVLGSAPASATGWCRGYGYYGYSPYYYYRPYYGYRPFYPRFYGGYFHRPRVWGWRGYGWRGYGFRAGWWGGPRWGWRGGWRRW